MTGSQTGPQRMSGAGEAGEAAGAASITPARSRRRIAVQLIAFIACMGLLGWAVSMAFSGDNRAALEHLQSAPRSLILAVVGLSALSLLINGSTLWLTLTPVRRLKLTDTLAANSIAVFFNYLPFKLSLVSRFVIHNRRDGMPLLQIGAWLAAFAVVVLAGLAPPVAASLVRPKVDGVWIAMVVGGIAVMFAAVTLAARLFAGDRGLQRVQSIGGIIPVSLLHRLLKSRAFAQLHTGFAMLSSPGVLGVLLVLRVADLLVQAARFELAARAVGGELGWDQALLAASAYFMIGILSPAGVLGARETGTAGVAALLTIPALTSDAFVLAVLVVTGAELIVNLVAAAASIAWLRPDRLLRGGTPVAAGPSAANTPPADPAARPDQSP